MPGARWFVFDTNVYVAALREGLNGATFEHLRRYAPRTVLASVVSAELRAGALDRAGIDAVQDLTEPFERRGRVVTPDANSWNQAGDVLADVWRREPRARATVRSLWNDALIALSARQIGATVVSGNVRDFALIGRYARFQFEPFEPPV